MNFSENKRTILCIALMVNLAIYITIFGSHFAVTLSYPDGLFIGAISCLPFAILYTSFEAYFYLRRDCWLWYASFIAHIFLFAFDLAMMISEALDTQSYHKLPYVIAYSIFFALAGVLEVLILVLFTNLPKKVSSCCLPSYPVVVIDKNGQLVSQNQIVSGQAVYIVNGTDRQEDQPTRSVNNPVFEADRISEE